MSEGVEELSIYLMSLKPRYARAIFAGVKKYELRRLTGLPPVEEGSRIVVYASGNVKALVGEFRAGRILQGAPEALWARVRRPGSGLGEDAWEYIRGAKRAMAIEVLEPRLYQRPVSLEEIRRIIPGWNPPFSYKRLEEGDPLLELVLQPIWASGLAQNPPDARKRGRLKLF
ncbi:MAG: DNA-binding protein [Desulfurococcales archaeon]|nr:DNA-binding protein [Desulfurococcales archaeon]